jgi:3'-phosphoadenosine 5'-phosphosulfate sulfotransferase (PAPS reductase)/FAD synthetase
MTTTPTLRILSLGAGVQSSALLIASAEGLLPKIDAAVFADTGWEPQAVYDQLDRLDREIAGPAGIPIHRVGVGNIRADALNPDHRFASMPMYVRNQDGTDGMGRRQCTSEYKLRPVRETTRTLLGATPKANGRPGRVPGNRWAEQWVGFSTDEADRAERRQDVGYSRSRYPLLELGWDRAKCLRYLARHGFGETVKSSCIGCPYRTSKSWRNMRDTRPEEFADAVAFDAAMRHGSARANTAGQPLREQMYLHRSRLPLDQAPIDRVTSVEWAERQGDLVELALITAEEAMEADAVTGCSPWSCGGTR